MPKRIGFIINPAADAGRCGARWTALAEGFRKDGIEAKELFTSRPGDALRFAQELGRDCDVIVAVGGDGTVFEIASGLLPGATGETRLCVVPLGTGNDAARQFGIRDAAQARMALRGEHTLTVDAIRIGCQAEGSAVSRFGLLFAGVGIVGDLLKQTTPRVKRVFGRRLAYPVGALRALRNYCTQRMSVTADDQKWEHRTVLVCASNAELSGGGMRLAPGAKMDDGLLNVNLCEAVNRATVVALLWRI